MKKMKGVKFYCWTFFLLDLASRRTRGDAAHRMHCRGSVIGETSFFHSYISPTRPIMYTGKEQKVRIGLNFRHHSPLSRPHGARYLKY